MGNAARAKLLRVYVLAAPELLTVEHAAKRSGVSVNIAERELRVLEKWGVLKRSKFSITVEGKRVPAAKQKEAAWSVDPDFKHAGALAKFVHEVSPVHYESVVPTLKRAGTFSAVVLSGIFLGDTSRPADLLLAADAFQEGRLDAAIRSLEASFGREIRYAIFTTPEFSYRLSTQDRLLRDTLDYPHIVLVDKTRLL